MKLKYLLVVGEGFEGIKSKNQRKVHLNFQFARSGSTGRFVTKTDLATLYMAFHRPPKCHPVGKGIWLNEN